MKAAPFAYVRPASVADAVSELDSGDGKVLAGGQSLVPVLAMRLGRPATLVDINAITELDTLTLTDDELVIGATVRQRTVEHDRRTARVPLLGMALPWVGHRELRSRGTVCGSIAHADPAAELGAVACCLDAQVEITGPHGTRVEGARDFLTGAMTTTAGSAEVLTRARFPVAGQGDGFGFAEYARRHGDFALAGVVAHVHVADGRADKAVLTAFGVSDRPVTRDVTEVMAQAGPDATALTEPMAALAAQVVDTSGDGHGSRGYRIRLVTALAAAELATAYRRAAGDE